jgi:hypothetical protein
MIYYKISIQYLSLGNKLINLIFEYPYCHKLFKINIKYLGKNEKVF